jgi:hypothetical protein
MQRRVILGIVVASILIHWSSCSFVGRCKGIWISPGPWTYLSIHETSDYVAGIISIRGYHFVIGFHDGDIVYQSHYQGTNAMTILIVSFW